MGPGVTTEVVVRVDEVGAVAVGASKRRLRFHSPPVVLRIGTSTPTPQRLRFLSDSPSVFVLRVFRICTLPTSMPGMSE